MGDQNKLLAIPSDWEPITRKSELAILGKLIEEASECAQAAARCIIQGLHALDPETGQVNIEKLRDELADVKAMTELFADIYALDKRIIDERFQIKYSHKYTWYKRLLAAEVETEKEEVHDEQ